MASTNDVQSSFIANFKLGDNICFNLNSIRSLYQNLDTSFPSNRKPITILNTCVIEALLVDFIRRVKIHTLEFTYLDVATRGAIRKFDSDSKNWNFEKSINKFAHYKLLGNSSDFYASLKYLRSLRNRIHIHNTVFGSNEASVWTAKALRGSEACLEFTAKYMSSHYPRPLEADFVGGLSLPWEPHFDSDKTKLHWRKLSLGG